MNSVSPQVSNSVTESTLHGCPPDEIERIATYLITEKGVNTYIKCNPTLLGYDFARERLNELGFDYIVFDDTHFREDLQWPTPCPRSSASSSSAPRRASPWRQAHQHLPGGRDPRRAAE